MKLEKVALRGIRGVQDGTWDFIDPRTDKPHRLVLVTGPSGSGKTRFLETILAAKEQMSPYGQRPNGVGFIRPGSLAAKASLRFRWTEEERAYGALDHNSSDAEAIFSTAAGRQSEDDGVVAILGRYEHGHATGKIEYFPAMRPAPTNGLGVGLSPFEQRPLRASGDPRKYASVVRIVHELAAGGPTADYFADLLARLSPVCRFEATDATSAFPACFRGYDGLRSLRELSSSELDAVVFAATAVLVGLAHSIVFIDSPELSADPSFVPRLADGLLALGEDVQIIAATRSAEWIREAKPGQIVRLGETA